MITGNEFLHVASRWAALRTADEATCRSAISRAYYGAFHLAWAFLKEIGVANPIPRDKIHWFVREALCNSGDGNAQLAGWTLAEVCRNRNHADYDLAGKCGTSADAVTTVQTADQVRDLLRSCAGASLETRERMRDAINRWRAINRV